MLEKRQEEFAKIPLVDISLATIKYLGYTDEKADELWSGWRWHAFLDERTFLGHCLTPMLFSELDDNGNIQTNYDVFDESDDWQAIMDGWGLNDEFQDKVMDERFKDLRLTESARYWTCKTVELRWSTLKHIQHASKQRVKPPMRLGDIRSSSTSAPAPWLQVPAESAPQRAQSEEGVTVLYKSIDVAKAYGIFPPSEGPYFGQTIESAPLRVEHGNILELIEGGRWSADFTCWANPLTMYPSRVLAEKFAAYSALRSYGHSPACLVKMSIPTKALRETLRIKDFSGEDGDEEWKQVVLINRKEDMVIPSLVSQMAIENVNLVVGKVSCNAGKAVVKMDEWEEMGAENVLMVDQGRGLKAAMQYAFLGEEWPFHLAESISVEKVEL
jgi:hypothetical protein